MNVRPKALIVEDDPLCAVTTAEYLEEYDFDYEHAGDNEEAFKILYRLSNSRQPLNVIVTDFFRPNGNGFELVKGIRSIPKQITVGGGLRVQQIPVVVYTGGGYDLAVRKIPQIDSRIPIVSKGPLDEELIKGIDEAMSTYTYEVLSGLQYVGLALISEEGYYQVVDAYSKMPTHEIETAHVTGGSKTIGQAYSSLVLVADRWKSAQIAVDEFEELLNEKTTTERDFQHFLELHPEFLLGDEYDSFWAEPILTSPVTGTQIRPDFILQPRALRSNSWNWAIVDLKRPNVPLLSNNSFHMDLSRYVYKVVTQLKDYLEFLSDPRNQAVVQRRFGGIAPNPKLVAVIGRLPNKHRDRYAILRSRLTGVSITTYDEILEFRRAKVAWARTASTFKVR